MSFVAVRECLRHHFFQSAILPNKILYVQHRLVRRKLTTSLVPTRLVLKNSQKTVTSTNLWRSKLYIKFACKTESKTQTLFQPLEKFSFLASFPLSTFNVFSTPRCKAPAYKIFNWRTTEPLFRRCVHVLNIFGQYACNSISVTWPRHVFVCN